MVLTALPGACTGRYVTGQRAVIVSHDDGGNERHQLSLLPLEVAGVRPAGPHVLLADLASPAGREQVTAVAAVDDLAMNGSLNWTPDSAALILASNTGREFTGVARYDVVSGRWTWLVTDDSADLAGWLSPDGPLLLVERNDDGASVLSLHDAGTGEPLREVTPDGEQVPCLVYRDAEPADPSLAGSAVLPVHGGPEGQARQNFNTYVQVLAAAGHIVVVPNVRGSVGYGKRWYSMDDVELRLDSVADLAAIHSHLPALGADPARAALWGGSYGAAWSWPGSRSSRNCGPPEWPSSASRPWSTARRAVSGSGQFRRMLAMRPHG